MKTRCLPAYLVLALCISVVGCRTENTNDSRLESARSTAKVFLDALKNEDAPSAYGVLSQAYKDRLSEEERKSKRYNLEVMQGSTRVKEWSLGAGKLSDSKNQATFEGTVSNNRQYPFRLVLTKVKAGNSWGVDVFTVQK